ncbi:hypothetical protein LTR12_014759 [Friedmanniomyces endolithicus]|nr:hypothetical protein LTR12_014759 [Friedmanniomyces endolithicus]
MAGSVQSRLLSLPPELRLEVYEYIFTGTFHNIDHDAHGASYPGILMACRQLRSGAIPFFYRLSRFYTTEVRWELNSRWLRRLPVGSRVSVFDRAAVCQHNAALKGDVSSLRLRGEGHTEEGAEAFERAEAKMGLAVAVDRRMVVREEALVRLGVLKAKNEGVLAWELGV